jgi:predicted PurR-regulated permease PerM
MPAVGVSQVVLLVSVAFWTWLWGPLGLLMASPLTVCVVVLGKHVSGLAFVGLLMDDTAALAPEAAFSLISHPARRRKRRIW